MLHFYSPFSLAPKSFIPQNNCYSLGDYVPRHPLPEATSQSKACIPPQDPTLLELVLAQPCPALPWVAPAELNVASRETGVNVREAGLTRYLVPVQTTK